MAVDDEGRTHAALFTVFDSKTAYYLAGGGDPDLRDSGAMTLLLWDSIQHASGFAEVFDFEGSMIPEIERFFRGFGGDLISCMKVSKSPWTPYTRTLFVG